MYLLCVFVKIMKKWKYLYFEKVLLVLWIYIICIILNNIVVDFKEICDLLISYLNVFDFLNSFKYYDNVDVIKFIILWYVI